MLIPKQNRIRDDKHRRWVAELPCCVSGVQGHTQAAHVSQGRMSMGMKASDDTCVPLSVPEHDLQHHQGEDRYWKPYGGIERAKELGNALYVKTGDTDYALMLLARFKMGFGK